MKDRVRWASYFNLCQSWRWWCYWKIVHHQQIMLQDRLLSHHIIFLPKINEPNSSSSFLYILWILPLLAILRNILYLLKPLFLFKLASVSSPTHILQFIIIKTWYINQDNNQKLNQILNFVNEWSPFWDSLHLFCTYLSTLTLQIYVHMKPWSTDKVKTASSLCSFLLFFLN